MSIKNKLSRGANDIFTIGLVVAKITYYHGRDHRWKLKDGI